MGGGKESIPTIVNGISIPICPRFTPASRTKWNTVCAVRTGNFAGYSVTESPVLAIKASSRVTLARA